jgi:ribosomal protein S18 acetylase RimI-like enzyme
MELSYKNADPDKERDRLLEYHCGSNYACESPLTQEQGYPSYRAKWLSTCQPAEYTASLAASLKDDRTILKLIAIASGEICGYVWATFQDMRGYDFTIAEIEDLFVEQSFRRKGIATAVMRMVEVATERLGVHWLRSGTGSNNLQSIKLHESQGYLVYRIEYEKRI